VINKITISL